MGRIVMEIRKKLIKKGRKIETNRERSDKKNKEGGREMEDMQGIYFCQY